MNSKLDICKKTRELASRSLYKTLEELLRSGKLVSEKDFRDVWLKNIRKNPTVFPDGWYLPPPHGTAVLFGTDEDMKRINTASLRPQEYWPNDDMYLDRNKGIMMLYFSPVDKNPESSVILVCQFI